MDHKSEVWLVKTHAKRGGGHQSFHLVVYQCIFKFYATLSSFPAVSLRMDTLRAQPLRNLRCITSTVRQLSLFSELMVKARTPIR